VKHPTKSTHTDKLERWLGAEQTQAISDNFKNFYWPVPVNGVPGNVYVMPGGDFAGEIKAGSFMNSRDGAKVTLRKLLKKAEQKVIRHKALGTLIDTIRAEDTRILSVGAFASVDAVVAAYTGGKGQAMAFSKTGAASNAIGNCNDLWTRAGFPGAGAAGAAAPGGTAPTSATTGAMPFNNLGTANTGHYLNWSLSASVINNSLLLYDRLFAVAKTMNSTATEAVTGTFSRYQNATAGTNDYIGGNFCFPSNPTTVLAATAHNWTVCQYTDQGGTTANSFASTAGVSAGVVSGIDLAVGQGWFLPLAAGDVGVKALTQMQCSALVATGTIDFVVGHPIAINACPIANLACLDDGLYTSLNLTSIFDSACLSFIEMPKPATTATNYSGILRCVSE
jgi:hypothetical protein